MRPLLQEADGAEARTLISLATTRQIGWEPTSSVTSKKRFLFQVLCLNRLWHLKSWTFYGLPKPQTWTSYGLPRRMASVASKSFLSVGKTLDRTNLYAIIASSLASRRSAFESLQCFESLAPNAFLSNSDGCVLFGFRFFCQFCNEVLWVIRSEFFPTSSTFASL